MKKAIIIGAGFSGCTLALLLKERGWDVTIIEKENCVGGGCRTFFYAGHPFTYGPRHFLSPYKQAFDFLKKYVPLRDIKKINCTFVEKDRNFYTYPIHEDDIPKMPEADQIYKELDARPVEASPNNFEEFWTCRIGKTLYEKFVKEYNKKAWQLGSNTEMDFGFEATVKAKPMETGERHEYKDWYNCYPIPYDGYNRYFDIALAGCNVLLHKIISGFDLEKRTVYFENDSQRADILISTTSPDFLMNNQYGELKFVGRDFHLILLPIESIFPKDVYFLYYPNSTESHTRVVEFKKFTHYQSPYTLLLLEVPSLNNKLYPTMIKAEVDKAQKYIDALPENIYSLGRMGIYRYIDIDDVILQSIEFVKKLEG